MARTPNNRRGIQALAAFALAIITAGSVGALAYAAVVNGNDQSLTQLATFGTLGLGGLLALSGSKRNENDDNDPGEE